MFQSLIRIMTFLLLLLHYLGEMDASEVDINIPTAVLLCDDSLSAQPNRREKRSRRISIEQKCDMFIRHKEKRERSSFRHTVTKPFSIFKTSYIISHVCIVLNLLSCIGASNSLLCLRIDDNKSI